MSSTLAQVKRDTLGKRLANLLEEYEVANTQLDRTLSEVDRVKLQRQIRELEASIREVETQLENLGTQSPADENETNEQANPQPPQHIASHQSPSSDCAAPPKPGDGVLDQYRYNTADMVLASIESAKERLRLVGEKTNYYEKLKLENPLLAAGGEVALQIERLEREERELQKELDELIAVLCWKLYERCLESISLQSQLESLTNQRDTLEQQGRYISYELKHEINDIQERIRDLKAITRKTKPYCG